MKRSSHGENGWFAIGRTTLLAGIVLVSSWGQDGAGNAARSGMPSPTPKQTGAARSHAYAITMFPAATVYDPDSRVLHERLGLEEAGLIIEDFEQAKLRDAVAVSLARRVDDSPLNLWDGARAGEIASEAEFKISLPAVRLFGIGFGDNDGGSEQISINHGPWIDLQSLPNHVTDGQKRAYYLLIEAEPGDEYIQSVSVKNAFSVICDHLVLKQDRLDPNRPLRLVFDLVDGSRVIGTSSDKSIMVRSAGLNTELSFERIARVEPLTESKTLKLILRNGDELATDLSFSVWKVSTVFGEVSIGVDKIKKITVQSLR